MRASTLGLIACWAGVQVDSGVSQVLAAFVTALAVNPVEAPSKSCKAPLQGHSRCRYFK